jgi:hypothetical protein
MGNRIPRTATKIEVTLLTDTSVGKSGIKIITEKTDYGWVGEYEKQSWRFFIGHLRNENYCSIKVIA